MKVAYLIMAHEQPGMFGRLIRAIASDYATTYVHVDAKVDEAAFRVAVGIGYPESPRFVSDRVYVNWGGYSQVKAMLSLLRTAHTSEDFDYYMFLSGRDYPIRSNEQLFAHLEQSKGLSYINSYPLVGNADLVSNVTQRWHYDLYARCPAGMVREGVKLAVAVTNRLMPARTKIGGLTPYRGSTSWCLSRAAVSHVLTVVEDRRSAAFMRSIRSVACCDEILFQTLLMNSPLAETCRGQGGASVGRIGAPMRNESDSNMHFIDWDPSRENPAVLVLRDLDRILASGKFFARKFDEAASAPLLDAIDALRLGRGAQEHSPSVQSGRVVRP